MRESEWLKIKKGKFLISEETICKKCGSSPIYSTDDGGMEYLTPFCPWCGSKMANPMIQNWYN